MAQSQAQAPNMDQFEVYFKRADLDQDGRISGNEAVSFFQATNLPRPVLAQIWTIADQNRTGFLGRQEFYNALKLVTVAQSKRELTPEIVKAALNSPASAKIPAPKIDLTPSPGPRSNIAAPPTAGSAVPPQNIGIRGPQGFTSPQIQVMRPPRPPFPSATFQTPQVASDPRMPYHGGTRPVSHPPSSSPWVGGNTGVSQAGLASQSIRSMGLVGQDSVAVAASGLPPPSTQPGAQAASVLMKPASSITSDTSVVEAKDSKALDVAANGYASDSLFGDVFSATSVQTKQDSTKVTSGVSSLPVSSTIVPVSSGAQPAVKSSPHDSSLQMTTAQPPVGSQQLQGQLPVKPNQRASVQASSAFPTGAVNSAAWPRMTQSDVQKYTKVFMQVGSHQDGKITGEQARDLFLSWGLPREVLKRVWDLSDQDNDSKLSLREFCIALYLMERYREGRPLPAVLPSGIMFDESVSPVTNQPVAPRGNTAWRATSPFQQPHSMKPPLGRPPRPIPGPAPQSEDSMHPSRQKPKVPVLEKHLLDQLSTEEQSTLNSKFQEASDAEKKVAELEKEILDAREKIQFFHAKMQELILYKSRCDNRLNEITERVSADKREVENLGKKYEEKYRQAGDVASKLTIEEATFRDIQEKKMELYRAIVKLEQDGSADGIQERTNLIQLDLEELVKSLNERCKTYGLRAKPTSLVELPFGWQPGIQEGAADWDENWDKFEDEGFSFVKELTLDVQNVIAPPKSKSSLREKESSVSGNGDAKSSSDDDGKAEMAQSTSNQRPENDGANTLNEDYSASSPPESPARSNAPQSELKEFEDFHSKRDISFDGSPHATQSEHGGAESMFSADKGFDEPGWGTFDTPYDTDAASEFNYKDVHSERQSDSLFGSDEWSLNPIRTSTSHTDNMYPKQSPFFDSVPSTPSYNIGGSPLAESMFQKKSPFGFADSIPSTPMYSSNNSPRRFGEGPEGRSFDSSFSRFDSFNMQDGGLFTPREPLSFTRFDSMRSTRDSEYDHGISASRDSLARFDSFRSMADSDYNFGLFPPRESFTRFDSIRSTRDSDFGHGFSSFDEADPFGSSDPFKTTLESQTPRRDSDGWNDHFNTSFESQTPRRDSDSWSDAFKTSFDSQTPRRDSDSWNDPFKTSFESQTPRRDSDSWKAF